MKEERDYNVTKQSITNNAFAFVIWVSAIAIAILVMLVVLEVTLRVLRVV